MSTLLCCIIAAESCRIKAPQRRHHHHRHAEAEEGQHPGPTFKVMVTPQSLGGVAAAAGAGAETYTERMASESWLSDGESPRRAPIERRGGAAAALAGTAGGGGGGAAGRGARATENLNNVYLFQC